jgi:hypothetical protein
MGPISDGTGRYFSALGDCTVPVLSPDITGKTLIGSVRFGSKAVIGL